MSESNVFQYKNSLNFLSSAGLELVLTLFWGLMKMSLLRTRLGSNLLRSKSQSPHSILSKGSFLVIANRFSKWWHGDDSSLSGMFSTIMLWSYLLKLELEEQSLCLTDILD